MLAGHCLQFALKSILGSLNKQIRQAYSATVSVIISYNLMV